MKFWWSSALERSLLLEIMEHDASLTISGASKNCDNDTYEDNGSLVTWSPGHRKSDTSSVMITWQVCRRQTRRHRTHWGSMKKMSVVHVRGWHRKCHYSRIGYLLKAVWVIIRIVIRNEMMLIRLKKNFSPISVREIWYSTKWINTDYRLLKMNDYPDTIYFIIIRFLDRE